MLLSGDFKLHETLFRMVLNNLLPIVLQGTFPQ